MLAGACGNRTHLGPYQGPALRLKRSKIHQDPSAPALLVLVPALVLVLVLELPSRTAEDEDDDEDEYDMRP